MEQGFKEQKTDYEGVRFIWGKDTDGKRQKIFYIWYRRRGERKRFHEPVGRSGKPDKMNAYLASRIRVRRIEGEKSNVEKREADAAAEVAEKAKISFTDYAEAWLVKGEGKKKKWAKSTKGDYKSAMNLYVIPHLGDIPLVDITPRDIIELVDSLPDITGKRKNNIMVPLKALFNRAKKMGDILINPAEGIDRKEETPTDIDPLSFPEMKSVLENIDRHYVAYFTTAFFTGMRPSEIIALKWKNVDFVMRLISVKEGRVQGEDGPLKTLSSYRDIDILAPLYEALQRHHAETFNGDKEGYVFTTPEGGPLQVDNLRNRVWYPALEAAGIKKRTMYQTRHTFASLMLLNAEDPAWVSKMLGHTTLQMLYKHYAKYIRSRDRQDGRKFAIGYESAKALPAGNPEIEVLAIGDGI